MVGLEYSDGLNIDSITRYKCIGQPSGSGKSSERSQLEVGDSPIALKVSCTSARFGRFTHGAVPFVSDSQKVVANAQQSDLALYFDSKTVSGAHHLTARGCRLTASSAPSGSTMDNPKSETFTVVEPGFSLISNTRMFLHDKSAWTTCTDCRNCIAFAAPSAANSKWSPVTLNPATGSVITVFSAPPLAISWITKAVFLSWQIPYIQGTKEVCPCFASRAKIRSSLVLLASLA
mmetsp:Transcript_52656/g.112828  ORF Transcript_52656/g.112828 Transcript_52656/m.112828 type:complete len:233 (+) Transcript_52656:714-1412(+)